MSNQGDLFRAPQEERLDHQGAKVKRLPLKDRIEQLFKENKFTAMSTAAVMRRFADHQPTAVRNAIRKLLKERTIKSTGEMAPAPFNLPAGLIAADYALLTASVYKQY